MTKAELIEKIALKQGTSKRAAEMSLEAVTQAIKDGLDQWQPVRIPGFGTFYAVLREARECRNPKTGEKIHVQPKRVVKFKASKNL